MSAGDDGTRENEILYTKHMWIGKFPRYTILRKCYDRNCEAQDCELPRQMKILHTPSSNNLFEISHWFLSYFFFKNVEHPRPLM